jgi:hypothetical protein
MKGDSICNLNGFILINLELVGKRLDLNARTL